jgi:hypothetical protein
MDTRHRVTAVLLRCPALRVAPGLQVHGGFLASFNDVLRGNARGQRLQDVALDIMGAELPTRYCCRSFATWHAMLRQQSEYVALTLSCALPVAVLCNCAV